MRHHRATTTLCLTYGERFESKERFDEITVHQTSDVDTP